MNWLILLIVGLSIAIVMSLLSRPPSSHSNQPGDRAPQLNTDRLLPVQHYDFDRGKKLLPLHRQVLNALGTSHLETARRICMQMRTEDSAVVELNLAKIALDQVKQYSDRMTPAQFQEQLGFVRGALGRAKWFIKHHRRGRYRKGIKRYLEYQEDRLARLSRAKDSRLWALMNKVRRLISR